MATNYKRVSRKQRQEVYRSLRAALIDVDNARIGYKSGHSDGTVAQLHGLSITDIENLRCQLVEEVMADLIATCQALNPRLAALEENTAARKEEVAALEEALAALKEELAALKEELAALEETIRRLGEFAEDGDVPNVLLH